MCPNNSNMTHFITHPRRFSEKGDLKVIYGEQDQLETIRGPQSLSFSPEQGRKRSQTVSKISIFQTKVSTSLLVTRFATRFWQKTRLVTDWEDR